MLEARDIVFGYTPSSKVLDGVSLRVRPHEIVALVGANGCGKSTLARIMAGSLRTTSGAVELDGKVLEQGWPQVGFVRQDPQAQLISELAQEDVAIGLVGHGLSEAEVEQRVNRTLDECSVAHVRHMNVSDLSGGEQQRLALAGVLVFEPEYLVMDEPTSQLDSTARRKFDQIVERRAARGMGVLLVTHRLEIARMAHRVAVLDAGRLAWEGTFEEFQSSPEALSMARMDPSYADTPRIGHKDAGGVDAQDAAPNGIRTSTLGDSIALRQVSVQASGYFALREVTAAVSPGSVTLVTGRSGAGKTTLAMVASGVLEPLEGRATVGGLPVHMGDVGLCQQHVEDQLFCDTVLEDVAFGPHNQGLSDKEALATAREALLAMGVREDLWGRSPFALSGGERRRVAMAGIMAMHPHAYVFDEPTAGLDGAGRQQTRALVRGLADEGFPILVISHDVDEWLSVADDVILLVEGSISYAGPAAHLVKDPTRFVEAGLQMPAVRDPNADDQQTDTADHGRVLPQAKLDMRVSHVTPLHRMPAGLKVLLLVALTVLLFATKSLALVCVLLGVSLVSLAFAEVPARDALRVMGGVAIVLVFAFVGSTLVLDGTGDVSLVGPVGISTAGAYRGAVSMLRIVTLALSATAVARSTTSSQTARAILSPLRPLSRVGLPWRELSTTVTLTLRCLPLAREAFRRVEVAQLVRRAPLHTGGIARRLRGWSSVLVPVLVMLMHRAEELGYALQERGFGMAELLATDAEGAGHDPGHADG